MKVLIVGGGDEPSGKLMVKYAKEVDKIIGVDRGCSYLLKNNIYPDYIVGDFDSINKEDIKRLEIDSMGLIPPNDSFIRSSLYQRI